MHFELLRPLSLFVGIFIIRLQKDTDSHTAMIYTDLIGLHAQGRRPVALAPCQHA